MKASLLFIFLLGLSISCARTSSSQFKVIMEPEPSRIFRKHLQSRPGKGGRWSGREAWWRLKRINYINTFSEEFQEIREKMMPLIFEVFRRG